MSFQTSMTLFILWNTKEDIMNKTISVTTDFHCMDKQFWDIY